MYSTNKFGNRTSASVVGASAIVALFVSVVPLPSVTVTLTLLNEKEKLWFYIDTRICLKNKLDFLFELWQIIFSLRCFVLPPAKVISRLIHFIFGHIYRSIYVALQFEIMQEWNWKKKPTLLVWPTFAPEPYTRK